MLTEDPLANRKTTCGIGRILLDAEGKPHRVGGVHFTIKDDIVSDAKPWLVDAREMVADDNARRGIATWSQPRAHQMRHPSTVSRTAASRDRQRIIRSREADSGR